MRTFLVFCFSVLIISTPLATAQVTTAFTYQGKLEKSNAFGMCLDGQGG